MRIAPVGRASSRTHLNQHHWRTVGHAVAKASRGDGGYNKLFDFGGRHPKFAVENPNAECVISFSPQQTLVSWVDTSPHTSLHRASEEDAIMPYPQASSSRCDRQYAA